MPASTLATGTLRGAALSLGALFAGCVVFYYVGGEAAWAAGIIFIMGFVPAVLAGALAGAAVHVLGQPRGGAGPQTAGDAGGPSPTPRGRRAGLWLLGAGAGYAVITYGLRYLLGPDQLGLIGMTLVVPAIIVGGAAALRADSLVGRQRVRGFAMLGLLAATPFLDSAWWAVQARRPLPPDLQRRWAADSADYERRLARWVSDSIALDSVAAARDRSALVALLRSQDATGGEDALQAQACEHARLSDLHGFDVAERMIDLANRDVWPSDRARKDALARLYGRVRRSTTFGAAETTGLGGAVVIAA